MAGKWQAHLSQHIFFLLYAIRQAAKDRAHSHVLEWFRQSLQFSYGFFKKSHRITEVSVK